MFCASSRDTKCPVSRRMKCTRSMRAFSNKFVMCSTSFMNRILVSNRRRPAARRTAAFVQRPESENRPRASRATQIGDVLDVTEIRFLRESFEHTSALLLEDCRACANTGVCEVPIATSLVTSPPPGNLREIVGPSALQSSGPSPARTCWRQPTSVRQTVLAMRRAHPVAVPLDCPID